MSRPPAPRSLALLLGASLLLAACGSGEPEGTTSSTATTSAQDPDAVDPDPSSSTSVEPPESAAARPVEFRQVLESGGTTEPGATQVALPDPSGECLLLDAAEVIADDDVEVEATPGQIGSWVIELRLGPDDAAALEVMTGRISAEDPPLNRLAVVVDGVVLSAPTVVDALPGGELVISGSFDADAALEVVRAITSPDAPSVPAPSCGPG